MRRLHFDFETFSEVNIKQAQMDTYARHPSTEVLMCAYAFDTGPVKIWVPAEGQQCPPDLHAALHDRENTLFCAWNKMFEWSILKHVLKIEIPHHLWFDASVVGQMCSYPAKLETAGSAMRIPGDKQKLAEGTRLIKKFSIPRKPTKKLPHARCTMLTDPKDWELFKQYCIGDVEAERAIEFRLGDNNLTDDEWRLWWLDQEINQKGIPIDVEFMEKAESLYQFEKVKLLKQMAKITGLQNPNSNKQLLPWLQSQGYGYADLKKGHIAKWYSRAPQGSALQKVLELRPHAASTSSSKFTKVKTLIGDQQVVRNSFRFYGASRTGRWAGSGMQPQNISRGEKKYANNAQYWVDVIKGNSPEVVSGLYGDVMNMSSSLIRSMIKPPDGQTLVVADLNAIENRVLGWITGDQKILEVFHKNLDPYIYFAQYLYNTPYATLMAEHKAGKSEKRTVSKPAVLGCGYMLSAGKWKEDPKSGEMEATGLLGYADNMGVQISIEESKKMVDTFRETFSEVKTFWYSFEKAVIDVVQNKRPCNFRNIFYIDMKRPFLRIRLPSGRFLHYVNPEVVNEPHPFRQGQFQRKLRYEGLGLNTKWSNLKTHPGKLTENVDQAISRDILAHGMMLASQQGLDIRMHIHDEIVCVSPNARAEQDLQILIQCMECVPHWAQGLPLGAEGYISERFRKD